MEPPLQSVCRSDSIPAGRHGAQQPDREDASLSRNTASVHLPAAGLNASSCQRESEAKTALVGVALCPRREQFVRIPDGKPAALVFDLKCHAVFGRDDAEPHLVSGMGELEGVAQEMASAAATRGTLMSLLTVLLPFQNATNESL